MGAVKTAYLAAFDVAVPPATASAIGDAFETMAGASLPPGSVIPCNLLAATIASDFTGGLGDTSTAYEGWAICDGNNGTPNLSDKFIRHKSTGASGSGGSDTHAHTHTLSSSGGAEIRFDGATIYRGATTGPAFAYDDVGTVTVGSGSGSRNSHPLLGATDGASSTENRPAYYELVYLMAV